MKRIIIVLLVTTLAIAYLCSPATFAHSEIGSTVQKAEDTNDIENYRIPVLKEHSRSTKDRFDGNVPGLRANYYFNASINTYFLHTIGSGDTNYYLITLPTNGKLSIELTGITGVDNDLYLFTTSGYMLEWSENPSGYNEYIYSIQSTGQYFIVVNNYAGYSNASYQLTILFSSNYDSAELDDYPHLAKSYGMYLRLNQNLDSYLDEDWLTFSITSNRNVLIDFASNDNTYAAVIYKLESGILVEKHVLLPSNKNTAEDHHILALTLGQYYVRVLALGYSYGSDYLLTVNAQHSNIADLIHYNSSLQNLVYRDNLIGGSLYVDGQMLGPFGWTYDDRFYMGSDTVGTNIIVSGGNRYHSNSVTSVGLYKRGSNIICYNAVKVRVVDVHYFYYHSQLIGGHFTYSIVQLYTGNPIDFPIQPEMYYVFDAISGECIDFESPNVFDELHPYGTITSFTPY